MSRSGWTRGTRGNFPTNRTTGLEMTTKLNPLPRNPRSRTSFGPLNGSDGDRRSGDAEADDRISPFRRGCGVQAADRGRAATQPPTRRRTSARRTSARPHAPRSGRTSIGGRVTTTSSPSRNRRRPSGGLRPHFDGGRRGERQGDDRTVDQAAALGGLSGPWGRGRVRRGRQRACGHGAHDRLCYRALPRGGSPRGAPTGPLGPAAAALRGNLHESSDRVREPHLPRRPAVRSQDVRARDDSSYALGPACSDVKAVETVQELHPAWGFGN